MSTTPKRVVVELAGKAADGLLEAIAQAGMITVSELEQAPAGKPCEVCSALTPEHLLPLHPELGVICVVCSATADRLTRRFKAAARKSYREFRDQLGQMVKDVRSGNEEPTFYQGYE